MADNPDPRPGRWLLPLVVLGMMLFTFVFVTELPGSESVSTTQPATASTETTEASPSTDVTEPTVNADPALQAYKDGLTALGTQLAAYQLEMAEVNAAWDATPQQIEAADIRLRLTTLRDNVATWASAVGEIVVPVGLESTQAIAADAASRAATAADDTLDGWVSSPGPEDRRAGVAAFEVAANDFAAAVAGI